MLLIEYNPEKYQDHMFSWAHWYLDQGKTGPGMRVKNTRAGTGARSSNSKPGQYFPHDYDTNVAVNAAVNSLGKSPRYGIHQQCIQAQFLTALTADQKAASVGLKPADFRRKLAEARKMIDQYMAGISNPLRYTYQARDPG